MSSIRNMTNVVLNKKYWQSTTTPFAKLNCGLSVQAQHRLSCLFHLVDELICGHLIRKTLVKNWMIKKKSYLKVYNCDEIVKFF